MIVGHRAPGSLRTLAQAIGIYLRAAPGVAMFRAGTSVATGLGPVATAWLTKVVLDRFATGSGQQVLPAVVALAATVGLLAVLQHAAGYADREIGRRVAVYTLDHLFTSVGRLPGVAELEDPGLHDRLRLAQQASSVAPQQLTNALLSILQASLTVLGFLISLATLSPVIAVLVVLSAVPTLYAQLSLARDRADTMFAISPKMRRQFFYSTLLLDLRAAKEIRLFGLASFFRKRMVAELTAAQAGERRVDRRTLRVDTVLSLVTAVVSGVALVVGAARIAGGGTVGDFSVLVAALAGVQSGLAGIIGQVATVNQTLVLFGHYLYVTTRLAPQRSVAESLRPVTALREGIELRDVWFRYHTSHDWVLRGVNLFIPAGASVALVGLNGSGKSTIVKLLCRLYEPQQGLIAWDGVDVRDLDLEQLRRRIAAVFQDYMTYDLSAADNIGIGNIDVNGDERRLHAAATFAGIHETLTRLPMGYDTTLSRIFVPDVSSRNPRLSTSNNAGVLLSGGQWQRVAIARAALRDDADLLILDEPSAGLDAEAEAAVLGRFQALGSDRTSLLISHRLNTVRTADLIVVLDSGRVVEQGSHEQLMAADSRYAALFRTQASGYQLTPDAAAGKA